MPRPEQLIKVKMRVVFELLPKQIKLEVTQQKIVPVEFAPQKGDFVRLDGRQTDWARVEAVLFDYPAGLIRVQIKQWNPTDRAAAHRRI